MRTFFQKTRLAVVLCALAFGGTQTALAQGNSANAPGKSGHAPGQNKNLGHGNASNGVKALIKANRDIFYSGDLLDIGVKFPRGAELVQNGEADAYLVIFNPDTTLQAVSISQNASEDTTKLFRIEEVDVDFLPEGVYQMGVVLTVPDGDPLNMSDWYNGMLGLLTVRGLTVSESSLDIDEDGDGFVDGDDSGDGFVDEDDSDGADDGTDDDGTDDSGDDTGDDDTTGGDA
jgi:hypothetical protein